MAPIDDHGAIRNGMQLVAPDWVDELEVSSCFTDRQVALIASVITGIKFGSDADSVCARAENYLEWLGRESDGRDD